MGLFFMGGILMHSYMKKAILAGIICLFVGHSAQAGVWSWFTESPWYKKAGVVIAACFVGKQIYNLLSKRQPSGISQGLRPSSASRMLDRTKLFDDIMGMSENEFRQLVGGTAGNKPNPKKVRDFLAQEADGLRSRSGGRAQALLTSSDYTEPTLGQLREQAKKKLHQNLEQGKRGSLHVILFDPNKPHEADIRYLHERFPGAYFQLASNFNALEGGCGDFSINLDHMARGPAQGEEACLATIGAAAYRRYALPPINHLDGLGDVFEIGSYWGTPAITGLKKLLGDIDHGDMNPFKISVHKNIIVSSGSDMSKKTFKPDFNKQLPVTGQGVIRVNHILTAAHDINPNRRTDLWLDNEITLGKHKAIVYHILSAAYEATILAAINNDAETLVLTMLGAGVFDNDPLWIPTILNILAPLLGASGMKVYLVIRHSDSKVMEAMRKEIMALSTRITVGDYLADHTLEGGLKHFFSHRGIE